MTPTTNTRNARIAADQAMINGVQKFLAKIATLPVGATPMKPTDIVATLQERIDKATAAQTADAALTAAVKAIATSKPARRGSFVHFAASSWACSKKPRTLSLSSA